MGPHARAKEHAWLSIVRAGNNTEGFVCSCHTHGTEAQVSEATIEGQLCLLCVATYHLHNPRIHSTIVVGRLRGQSVVCLIIQLQSLSSFLL